MFADHDLMHRPGARLHLVMSQGNAYKARDLLKLVVKRHQVRH